MKGNFLLVGLDYQFVKDIASMLAQKLDMFFLDVNDLLEYQIIDKEKMQLICGMEYFESEKKKVILSVSEYENTIINFPYSFILNKEYHNILKNSRMIFLKMDKTLLNKLNNKKNKESKLDIELITVDELTTLLSEMANTIVEVDCENADKIVKKLEKLEDFN